jgi:hypothetical protein
MASHQELWSQKGMELLQVADAKSIVLGLQDGIRSSEELPNDDRLLGHFRGGPLSVDKMTEGSTSSCSRKGRSERESWSQRGATKASGLARECGYSRRVEVSALNQARNRLPLI